MTAKVLAELKPFAPLSFTALDEGIELHEKILEDTQADILSHSTTAAPIVATTITLEALQDFLHKQGYPVEASPCSEDVYMGPFDDTQFDMVVDVQTQPDENPLQMDSVDVMSSCSDLSEEDLSVLPGMSILSSVRDFSDEDLEEFYSDSGVESDECSEEHATNTKTVKTLKEEPQSDDVKADQTLASSVNIKTEPKSPEPFLEVEEDITVATEYESDVNPDQEDISRFKSCQFLWEFLQALLSDRRFTQFIEWKHEKQGIFRMKDHHGLARLWGKHKRKKNMTYDKLSRALRHYYHKNIMKKVEGQRLTYRYCKGYMPTRWK